MTDTDCLEWLRIKKFSLVPLHDHAALPWTVQLDGGCILGRGAKPTDAIRVAVYAVELLEGKRK